MEDISGDQWEHFAAVSRNDPVTQDFSIQQHSPARSETAPLGPDDRAGGACARPACACVCLHSVYGLSTSGCSVGGLRLRPLFSVICQSEAPLP